MSKPVHFANITGPEIPHGDARITLNRQAAWQLRGALRKVLDGPPEHVQFFASDGEGYDLHIVVTDDLEEFPEQGYSG